MAKAATKSAIETKIEKTEKQIADHVATLADLDEQRRKLSTEANQHEGERKGRIAKLYDRLADAIIGGDDPSEIEGEIVLAETQNKRYPLALEKINQRIIDERKALAVARAKLARQQIEDTRRRASELISDMPLGDTAKWAELGVLWNEGRIILTPLVQTVDLSKRIHKGVFLNPGLAAQTIHTLTIKALNGDVQPINLAELLFTDQTIEPFIADLLGEKVGLLEV